LTHHYPVDLNLYSTCTVAASVYLPRAEKQKSLKIKGELVSKPVSLLAS